MRLSLLPTSVLLSSATLLGSSVYAQGSGSSSVVDELVNTLTCAGFKTFANYTSTLNQTSTGQELISKLSNGSYTVFAPTDEAFTNASLAYIFSDPEVLASYISYHFVHGDLSNSTNSSSSSGGGGGVGGGGGGSSSIVTVTSTVSSSHSSSASSSASQSESSAAAGGGGGGNSSSTSSPSSTSSSPETSTITSTSTSTGSATVAARSRFWAGEGQGTQGADSNCTSGSPVQLQSGVYPTDTVGRTLLSSPQFVSLEGNKSQVLAWTRPSEAENVTILNQIENITVVNSTKYNNFFVNGINGVLTPPGNITIALDAINATAFHSIASSVPFPSGGGNGTVTEAFDQLRGFTLFLPNNDALSSNQAIENLKNNNTALDILLAAHLINESTIYSPVLRESSSNLTNAAGEPLHVTTNATGLFISDNNRSAAEIVRPDVLVKNGVIHVINRPLFDLADNPQAASSAVSSASSSAAISSTETGAIGGSLTSSGPAASSTSSGSASGSQSESSTASTSSSTGGGGNGESSTLTATATVTPTPSVMSRHSLSKRSDAASGLGGIRLWLSIMFALGVLLVI